MFKVRDDEPSSDFIARADAPERNQYGKFIELIQTADALAGKSLNINGDCAVSENPDRYKQHGFYFNADNCIACHACESACSEKNNLEPHLAFRAVGYVEGGSYPDYHRMNISMACNHCDDPVCLKGCPTRAYTKFAEYGAVLQDPDICFGCGYCTWVCPYNAPQLDPVQGHVEKCNMCIDRLEVGLKPACVAACLAGALDFGVIETTPTNRDQLETQIPGFPTPEITHPNIRFQQSKNLPREMTRPDSMPIRYERDEQGQGEYKTKVRATGTGRQWNLKHLSSRENPLVLFTLLTQGAVGAFLILFLGSWLGLESIAAKSYPLVNSLLLFGLVAAQALALALSAMHLGKPHRFYRGFNNLRYSPVSREAAGIVVFLGMLGAYTVIDVASNTLPQLFAWLPAELVISAREFFEWGALVTGPIAVYLMYLAYRIKARPYWNHWQTLTTFVGNTLVLGALLIGMVYGSVQIFEGKPVAGLLQWLAWPVVIGLVVEGIGLIVHARDLTQQGGEGAASHYEQRTRFGKSYVSRNTGLLLGAVAMAGIGFASPEGWPGLTLWFVLSTLIIFTLLVGRALYYVLVIPTTMPGAFFWRNRGFQEHARATGLAEMPQVGVVPDSH
ncbi:MAG: DmsC/YnfH family molybdoenzyme membrane anchor subunit [Acidiferrobacterales bacterium]